MAIGVRWKARGGWRAAVLAGAACAVAVAVALAACITTVPDLPQYKLLPPYIVTDAVQPPVGPLLQWPAGGEFTVPVEVFTPGETFVYQVVYDYGTNNQSVPVSVNTGQVAPDGGVTVPLTLQIPNPDLCPHHIDFIVANAFQAVHVPDLVGGSVASWLYEPGGTGVCPGFDAGTGAFPLPEASIDSGLAVVGGNP